MSFAADFKPARVVPSPNHDGRTRAIDMIVLHYTGMASGEDALARLCDPLVTELTSGHPERIKICDNDRCRWVFYDTSRTGRRRWCDMATCGNRAKAARHRARVKGAGEIDGDAAASD